MDEAISLQRKRLLILQEVSSRLKDDPLARWKPTTKQEPFVQSVLKGLKRENWFVAANRSGKTDAGAYIGATMARYGDQSDSVRAVGAKDSSITVRDRATSGWVVAVDFPTSRDVLQPKYFNNGFVPGGASHQPFIPDSEIEDWRAGDQILKLKNGSLIGFKSAESGREKFQGAGKDWVHFDEEPRKELYEETVIRVEGGRVLRVFGTCTILPPEGVAGGVSWLFPQIIQPWQAGNLSDVGIFTASIYDNPFILPEEIRRLEGIYPEGTVANRIRLKGELLPGMGGARAYSNFTEQLHVKSQPSIHPRRPLCWIWDFNVEPMVTLIGQREGKRFRVLRELVLDQGSLDDMCQLFYDAVPQHFAEVWVYGDATAIRRHHQSGLSDYTIILNNMRQYGAPVKLRLPEKNPPVNDRVNAVNRALRDERGEIWLEIDPSCRELRADLLEVLFDNRGGIKKVNKRNDPYYRRTHSSDALGYWICYEDPVRLATVDKQEGRPIKVKRPGYSFGGVRSMRFR